MPGRGRIRPDLYDEFQRTNEADFAYSKPGVGRFQVNAFRQRGSVGMVLRRVQEGAMAIGELGLPR
jgi:twitching motility protein PilT